MGLRSGEPADAVKLVNDTVIPGATSRSAGRATTLAAANRSNKSSVRLNEMLPLGSHCENVLVNSVGVTVTPDALVATELPRAVRRVETKRTPRLAT